uniref:Uncharacterized protein n=1 Tax=Micrurus lemniscatus lemniscatus TaxID=129467 RepID=A0A2D4J353_MICLE
MTMMIANGKMGKRKSSLLPTIHLLRNFSPRTLQIKIGTAGERTSPCYQLSKSASTIWLKKKIVSAFLVPVSLPPFLFFAIYQEIVLSLTRLYKALVFLIKPSNSLIGVN